MKYKSNSWLWVPSLYFAEGLPYVFVMSVSVIFYKRLSLSNSEIAFYTSWLYIPWIIKPLWSPIVELFSTKKNWIVITQFLIGLAFGGISFSLLADNSIKISMLFFALIAFASATHDISADGFYILAQDKKNQAKFVGIRSAFYRVAMITGQGLFVILAGYLENKFGNVKNAWFAVYLVVFLLFLLLSGYHKFILPVNKLILSGELKRNGLKDFIEPFIDFFKKENILLVISFLLFFRFSEAQLVKLATPFLLDDFNKGGLGLSTSQIGFIYGTIGVIFLVIGGISGGIAISKKGLRYWLLPMVFMINVPNVVYLLFAIFQPTNSYLILSGVAFEQFGYGFGFTAYLVYAMYISEGKFTTSHYAIATGIMALGMMLPGMISGYLQELLGYVNFFWWIIISTLPSFFVGMRIKIEETYGKK